MRAIPLYILTLIYPRNKYGSIRQWLYSRFGSSLLRKGLRIYIPEWILPQVVPDEYNAWLLERFSVQWGIFERIKKPTLFERWRLMSMFLTIEECSFLLNIEEEDLRHAVKTKLLKGVEIGRNTYISRAEVERLLHMRIPMRQILLLRERRNK